MNAEFGPRHGEAADLYEVDLRGRDLSDKMLSEIAFHRADLGEAGLRRSNLAWAEMNGANVSGFGEGDCTAMRYVPPPHICSTDPPVLTGVEFRIVVEVIHDRSLYQPGRLTCPPGLFPVLELGCGT